MKKILLIGYTHDDLPFILHLDTLCQELEAKCFSIAVGQEEHQFDLEKKIEQHRAKAHKIKAIAQETFQVNLDVLTNHAFSGVEESASTLHTNAFDLLARQAKHLSFHTAILNALKNNQVTHFYGINKQSHQQLFENLDTYQTEHIAILVEKEYMLELKELLQPSKTIIEVFFLTSASYELPEETKAFLKNAKILISHIVEKKEHAHSIPSLIQKALRLLNKQMHLLTSSKTTKAKFYSHTPRDIKNSTKENMGVRMKRALRGILDD